MKIKKLLCAVLAAVAAMPTVSAFAMSTAEFDNGMRNGINYFNRGLYYEARDEFQWFCDYNWGNMNSGQQKYALDYLGATKQKIAKWESSHPIIGDVFELVGLSHKELENRLGYAHDSSLSATVRDGGMLCYYGDFRGFFYYKPDKGKYPVRYGSPSYPYSYSTWDCVVIPLGDLISNPKWTYTNSELESIFSSYGERIENELSCMAGYSYNYNGCAINIFNRGIDFTENEWGSFDQCQWNGIIYGDAYVEIAVNPYDIGVNSFTANIWP